jgi:hypothetical protein
MRRRLAWLLAALGIVALVRRLRRKGEPAEPAPTAVADEDPANELRRKLEESRSDDEPAQAPEAAAATVEERRADVHDQGRAALDEMGVDDTREPDEG